MQTTNYPHYNNLTIDQIRAMFRQITNRIVVHTAALDCHITNYAPCGRSPRRQISFGGQNYSCSLVMGLYHQRVILGDQNYQITVGHEASHLCHLAGCVNPLHIHFEDGEINRSRACCEVFGHLAGYFCPHLPHCLTAFQFVF